MGLVMGYRFNNKKTDIVNSCRNNENKLRFSRKLRAIHENKDNYVTDIPRIAKNKIDFQ